MSLEDKFETLIKSYQSLSLSKKALESPTESDQGHKSEAESHALESTSDEEPPRSPRSEKRLTSNSNDFRVNIPKFEGKLDSEEFLNWLNIVERIFEYKVVPEDKKVKLIALNFKSMPLCGGLI